MFEICLILGYIFIGIVTYSVVPESIFESHEAPPGAVFGIFWPLVIFGLIIFYCATKLRKFIQSKPWKNIGY